MNLKDLASAVALEASHHNADPNTLEGAEKLMMDAPEQLFKQLDSLSPSEFFEVLRMAGDSYQTYRAMAFAINQLGGTL